MNISTKFLYGFVASAVLLEFATYASNDMIMPAMPIVIKEFGGSLIDMPLSMSLYILGGTVFQLFVSPISDYLGRKTTLLLGALYFILTALVTIFSKSMDVFLSIRFASGASLAFISLVYASVHSHFNDKEATKITSLMQNFTIISPILGPMFGLLIIKHFSWHFIFIFCTLLGLISFLGISFFMPKARMPKNKTSLSTLFRGYLSLFKKRIFLATVLAVLAMQVPYLLWIAFSTTVIKEVLHLDDYHYVALQILALGGPFLSTLVIHLFAGKYSFKVLLSIGTALALLGLCLPSICPDYIYLTAIGTAIYGLGAGVFNALAMRILGTMEFHNSTMIFTLFTFVLSGGIFVFITLFELFFSFYNYATRAFAVSGLIFALFVALFSSYFIYINRKRAWQ